MDTNSPEDDHWWPIMAGESPPPDWMTDEDKLTYILPPNWEFFSQPAAMSELLDGEKRLIGYDVAATAENLEFLADDYYPNLIEGKTKSWIDVYVLNRLGSDQEGKSVQKGFIRDIHVARENIEAVDGVPLLIGLDFGLTPAAIIIQLVSGRWKVLEEMVTSDMSVKAFGQRLKLHLAMYYPGLPARTWGDPAGDYRAQTDEMTPFRLLDAIGIQANPAPGENDLTMRIEAVDAVLSRMVDGQPGIIVSPKCRTLISGLEGKYEYKRRRTAGGIKYDPVPDKNHYSHICEALQYAMLGAGEGTRLLTRPGGIRKVGNIRGSWKKFGQSSRQRLRGGRAEQRT